MGDSSQLFGVLAQMPFGVVCVHSDGKIGYANAFAEEQIFGGVPIAGEDFDQIVERFRLRGESLATVLETELAADQLLLAVECEGLRRYYSLTVAGPGAGEDAPTVIVFQEASPLVGLGQWLARVVARSSSAESTPSLVRRLAHEVALLVRNPLAAMTINAALLSRTEAGTASSQEIAADIEDAAAQIADAVDRLVAFGRAGVSDPSRPLILDAG